GKSPGDWFVNHVHVGEARTRRVNGVHSSGSRAGPTRPRRRRRARAPGVFAPGCSKHETVQSDGAVYDTTIDFQGVPRHFFDVWSLWKAGTSPLPVVLVADTPADSTCVDE